MTDQQNHTIDYLHIIITALKLLSVNFFIQLPIIICL